ncbi:nucleoside-diphosphate-sugar epimerase [Nocardia transvalensis]|uniref:Nucleoside-diphosphate-sugar epimerase n=1 Tax=Nocardia transvalensis TaxID=37333 RepID=A0A7W9UJM9_9NOCA|nr:SDR family oxidoreductase [Nocardia transvalensis]MBB5915619.1 nucleoside-diphosphate-sugar epimerase [Nocardia transvalensis]
MHVFVTGATGWIGSSVVDHLLDAGHRVTGLARSDASAAALERKGAQVLRGDLVNLDSIRSGAAGSDAVVHLANKHDFANAAATNQAERGAVRAVGEVLAGSGQPFVVASGLLSVAPDREATEQDPSPFHGVDSARGGSENLALELVGNGVGTIVARFAPSVHGEGDRGFVAGLVATARATGISAYIDAGDNRWAAIHRSDAGRVVRLALEKQLAPGTIVHAVAENGRTTREIAEVIGRGLGLPVDSVPADRADAHFGWLSRFFGTGMAATSEATRALLDWKPNGPSLVEDLDGGSYYR